MPIAEPQAVGPGARNAEPGLLLIGAGAILLLISLFLAWFTPGIEAWDLFEVWDLVLAAAAIAALVAVAGRLGYGAPRPSSWLLVPAAVALVVVIASLLDHPPLVDGRGHDPTTGIWLALVAALLMVAGTVLSVARISVALNVGDGGPARPGRGRFGRGGADRADYPAAPPAAGRPVDPGYPPAAGGTPPTDPTRRL